MNENTNKMNEVAMNEEEYDVNYEKVLKLISKKKLLYWALGFKAVLIMMIAYEQLTNGIVPWTPAMITFVGDVFFDFWFSGYYINDFIRICTKVVKALSHFFGIFGLFGLFVFACAVIFLLAIILFSVFAYIFCSPIICFLAIVLNDYKFKETDKVSITESKSNE